MDLRPSDVWLQASKVLGEGSRAAGRISGALYEADRVTQVNRGLAQYERAMQGYFEDYSRRSFVVESIDELGLATTTPRRLGELTQADVDVDYAKFVESEIENMQKTVRNPAARKELLQHLQMGGIANRGKALQAWQVAADHEALANFNNLYAVVMASDTPPDEKVRRISGRVDEMVATGRMWKNVGEEIKLKAQDSARYSFAYNGAMAITKETNDPAAGGAWLKENTPFYEGNPDARAKVLQAVRKEHRYLQNVEDEKVRRADDEADEDMQGYFATHHDDPLAVEAYLENPENDFSDRMISETYRSWRGWIDSALGGKAPDKDRVAAQKSLGWAIVENPYMTAREKRVQLREDISDPELRAKFTGMDLDKWADPRIREIPSIIEELWKPKFDAIEKERLKNPDDPAAKQRWTQAILARDALIDRVYGQIDAIDLEKSSSQEIDADLDEIMRIVVRDHIAGEFTTRVTTQYARRPNEFKDLIQNIQGRAGAYAILSGDEILALEGGTSDYLAEAFDTTPELYGRTKENNRPIFLVDGRPMTLRYDEASKQIVVQISDGGKWVDIDVPQPAFPGTPTKELTDAEIEEALSKKTVRSAGARGTRDDVLDLQRLEAIQLEATERAGEERRRKLLEENEKRRARFRR